MMAKNLLVVKVLGLVFVMGVAGCISEERIRTYGVAEINNDTVVSGEIVEERTTKGKKKIVQKQHIHERVPCIGEDGQLIHVKTVAECMRGGGKIVDESFLENSRIKNK